MSNLYIKKIIKLNNQILSDWSSHKGIISISWLYIKRLHPHYLRNYDIIKKRKIFVLLYSLIIFFLNFIKFSRLIFNSFSYNDYQLSLEKSVLIISHFINKHNYENYDFYYHNFDKYLQNKNKLSKVLLINDQNINAQVINDNYFILPNTLGFNDLIKILFNQLRLIPVIKKKYLKCNDILEKKILLILLSKIICPSTIFNLIKGFQISEILKKSKIKICICNFEGNAIERVLFHSIFEADPDIIKIGYSHTTDFPFRNSIYLNLNKKLMPNYTFVNSLIVKKEFQKKGFRNLILTGLLSKENNFKNLPKNTNNNILLIPEGINEELKQFIHFVKTISSSFKNYNFIIRVHPVLKSNLSSSYKNIFFSSNELSQDINNSNYVIFRGSTLVIHCIKYGLIPIYLKFDEPYDFHIFPPMYKKKIAKITYNNFKNFNFANQILDNNLKNFSNDYFLKYNKNKIDKFFLDIKND